MSSFELATKTFSVLIDGDTVDEQSDGIRYWL